MVKGRGQQLSHYFHPLLSSTPTEGHLSLDRFNVLRPLYTAGLQRYQTRTHALESMTLTTWLPQPKFNPNRATYRLYKLYGVILQF
ncbi:hypothetical protein TNCV_1223531 [Trichonephila clavipes]|nr:hypothetical protein TNCV_1223531 [Trichonephila clavipes]